jgi:hypothetical protein
MRLVSLQKWMQSVVVHAGTTEAALRSRGARAHLPSGLIDEVLLPSPTLTAAQRIAVYQEMYPLRMRDALSSDYPAIEHFLGNRFGDLVTAYTAAHPSMGYTLNRLGDHMPEFLGRQRTFKPSAFLRDLAKLELAITQAFDAPAADTIQAEALEAVPPNKLGRCRLVTSPSLRLVALEWNAADYLDTLRDDEHRHPKPRRASSAVVVVRRNFSAYRFEVTPAAFAVLSDLRDGVTIGQVVKRAMARRGVRRRA